MRIAVLSWQDHWPLYFDCCREEELLKLELELTFALLYAICFFAGETFLHTSC